MFFSLLKFIVIWLIIVAQTFIVYTEIYVRLRVIQVYFFKREIVLHVFSYMVK